MHESPGLLQRFDSVCIKGLRPHGTTAASIQINPARTLLILTCSMRSIPCQQVHSSVKTQIWRFWATVTHWGRSLSLCRQTDQKAYLSKPTHVVGVEAPNANVAVDLHVNDAPCPSERLMEDEWCLSASLGRRPGHLLITFFLKVVFISIDHHCCYIN